MHYNKAVSSFFLIDWGNVLGAKASGVFCYSGEKEKSVFMKNERTKAFVRLAVMVVLAINMGLTLVGKNPVPLDESVLTEWLSVGLAGLSAV